MMNYWETEYDNFKQCRAKIEFLREYIFDVERELKEFVEEYTNYQDIERMFKSYALYAFNYTDYESLDDEDKHFLNTHLPYVNQALERSSKVLFDVKKCRQLLDYLYFLFEERISETDRWKREENEAKNNLQT